MAERITKRENDQATRSKEQQEKIDWEKVWLCGIILLIQRTLSPSATLKAVGRARQICTEIHVLTIRTQPQQIILAISSVLVKET